MYTYTILYNLLYLNLQVSITLSDLLGYAAISRNGNNINLEKQLLLLFNRSTSTTNKDIENYTLYSSICQFCVCNVCAILYVRKLVLSPILTQWNMNKKLILNFTFKTSYTWVLAAFLKHFGDPYKWAGVQIEVMGWL